MLTADLPLGGAILYGPSRAQTQDLLYVRQMYKADVITATLQIHSVMLALLKTMPPPTGI